MKFLIVFVATTACVIANSLKEAGHFGNAYIPSYPGYPSDSSLRYAADAPSQITVLPNGYLADTPEVAQAKAVHYAELAKAATSPSDDGLYRGEIAPTIYSSLYRTYQYSTSPAQITVLPNGHLADTPEVAQAKVIHHAELAKAASLNAGSLDDGSYKEPITYTVPLISSTPLISSPAVYATRYNPITPSQITVLPDGHLADTPEVAQAKVLHHAEIAKAASLNAGSQDDGSYKEPITYTAPLISSTPLISSPPVYATRYNPITPSQITVLPDGHLADTPEVAQAKVLHHAEIAKAASLNAGSQDDGSYKEPIPITYTAPLISSPPLYATTYKSYTPSQITVLPDGHLADTPEVALAKSAHYAEIAKAVSLDDGSQDDGSYKEPITYTAPLISSSPVYVTRYNPYTPSQITVLPDGHLADTPEVAQARAVHHAELVKASGVPITYTAPLTYSNPLYATTYNSYTPSQITVLPSGYIADTPEVAYAKALHHAELAKAHRHVTL